jgi:dihydropteroate synthase
MHWKGRHFEFLFPRPALVMGIVNVTPDSFSDGGRWFETTAAVEHALELAENGADVIDIGGESTRPNARAVTEAEELRRVLPVLEGLKDRLGVPISIDTRKPEVARLALQAGASIVNDIQANRTDETMWRVTAEAQAGYVLMHMQGHPETMQENPCYKDVVAEIAQFFTEQTSRVERAGVEPERIVLDVGIGFGKGIKHNLMLLAALKHFTKLKRPLLLGASRKSFIGKLLGADEERRLAASLACACWAVQCGVQIIRTHDVFETVQAVRMTELILENRD